MGVAALAGRRAMNRETEEVSRMTKISKGLAQLPSQPHALYRFFDRTDVLLYVGITMNLPQRMANHRRDKPWWTLVDHITIEHFNTRDEVLAAERNAIHDEQPLYNTRHAEMVQAPGTPPGERCDPQCDDECLASHSTPAGARNSLALDLIWRVCDPLGEERLHPAAEAAKRDLAQPEDERHYQGEDDEVVIACYEVVERVVSDVWRFCHVMESVLRELPKDVRDQCVNDAHEDWIKATGGPPPLRVDLLPDILRHLGHRLGAPRRPTGGEEGD